MDEDSIVHEIVNSLAFEIEAVNQDNVLKWSTTNGTPLNVKVRVRNKDEPRLVQRGPIPVTKIGITAPEKLRLISSDQTILSFNVYMEDNLAKQEDSKRRNGFKLFSIGGCLGTYSDDEGPYLPGSSKQDALGSKNSSKSESGIHNEKVAHVMDTSNTVSQKEEGFFGKCKRGGCLDPPFDEDMYPYGLPKTNHQAKLEFEVQELEENKQYKSGGCLDPPFGEVKYPYAPKKPINEVKLKLSELEDNNLTHSTSMTSSDSPKKNKTQNTKHKTSVQDTKSEVDPTKLMDIYARTSKENSLPLKYSNSIITYATDISSTETISDRIPNKRKSVRSYDEDSQRHSYDYPQSYFVPPKNISRYKEEESKYSRELSDDQIRKGSKHMSSDAKDNIKNVKESVEYRAVSRNSNCSRDKDKVKLALIEPLGIDAIKNLSEHKQNIPSASYVQTDTKIDDSKNDTVEKLKSNKETFPKNSPSAHDVEFLKNVNNSTETDANWDKFSALEIENKDEAIESHSNAIKMMDPLLQGKSNVNNMHEQIHAMTDLNNHPNQNIDRIRRVETETIKKEIQGNPASSHTVILDETKEKKNLSGIPYQKDSINFESKKQSITYPKKNVTSDNQPVSKIIQPIKPEVVAKKSPTSQKKKNMNMVEKALNLEDQENIMKDNMATPDEMNRKFQSEAVKKEDIQKEHRKLSQDHISAQNTEFDVSSSSSMDSKQELLFNGYINNQEQDMPTVNLNAANEDSAIIQRELLSDKNIKATLDSTDKIKNGVLQKTPFIPRHNSDIRNGEVNKTLPLKRNTFTIIGSDTSLLKQEEDEEITESIPEVYLKPTDKAILNTSSDTYNKLHVLDAHNNFSDTNIRSLSDAATSLNDRDNESDAQTKIPDKSISFDEFRNNMETLNERKKQDQKNLVADIHTDQMLENARSISTSSKQAKGLVDKKPENIVYSEEYFSQEPLSTNLKKLNSQMSDNRKSVFTGQEPAKTTFSDVNNQKVIAKTYKNASVDSSKLLTAENVKRPHIEVTETSKLNINDQRQENQAALNTEQETLSVMAKSDTKLREFLPMPAKNIYSEINDDNIMTLSPITNNASFARDTSKERISENMWDMNSKITGDNNSAHSTQIFDKIENLGTAKELEKLMDKNYSVENLQNLKPEYLKEFYFDINAKDNLYASEKVKSSLSNSKESENIIHGSDLNLTQKSINNKELEIIMSKKTDTSNYTAVSQSPVTGRNVTDSGNISSIDPVSDKAETFELHNGSVIDTSQKSDLENESNSYPKLIDDEKKNDISTRKHSLLELKEVKSTNVHTDSIQKLVPGNEENLYFKIRDNSKGSSISNEIDELDRRYQQSENEVYIKSDVHAPLTSDNEQILDPAMPRKSSDKWDSFVHKEYDNRIDKTSIDSLQKVILDNVRSSQTLITADGKFEFSGKTYDERGIFDEEGILDKNNISNATKHEIPSIDIGVHDSYGIKYQKPTNVEPSFHTDSKTNVAAYGKTDIPHSVYNNTEFTEKGSLIGEVLSNITEHFEGDEKISAQLVGHEDPGGGIISQFYNETNIPKDSGSTEALTSISNSDLDPGLFKSNYNVPRNAMVSTLKLGTDENDTGGRPIAKALESIKNTSHSFDQTSQNYLTGTTTSNIDSSGVPLDSVTGITGEPIKYQWPKVFIPINDSVKDNLDRKPYPGISVNKAFAIYEQPALTTQKEKTSPQQVMLERQNLTNTSVPKINTIRIESDPLEKDKSPLYLDMSFCSYIDENNQRIIQTLPFTEQQHDDGTVTVIKSLIRYGNQIRIPIDEENDLGLNILDKLDICKKDAGIRPTTSHVRRDKHEIDRTSKRKAVLNKNLALIYESELIPLHNAIRDLTQEVNLLTVKRDILQEKKQNVNRTKSLRLIPVKRCGCRRI